MNLVDFIDLLKTFPETVTIERLVNELKARGVEVREEIVVKEEKVEEVTPEQNALIENKLWEGEIRGLIARIQGAEKQSEYRGLAVCCLLDCIDKLHFDTRLMEGAVSVEGEKL